MVGSRSFLTFGVSTAWAPVGAGEGTPGRSAKTDHAAITSAVAPITGKTTRQFSNMARRGATTVSENDPDPSALSLPTTLWWKDTDGWMSGSVSAAFNRSVTFVISSR